MVDDNTIDGGNGSGSVLRSPERFLEAHGATFSHVFVSRHYVATHYLAAVRKHAPAAKFVFDRSGCVGSEP